MLCQSNACGLDVLTDSSNVHLNLGLNLFHPYFEFVSLSRVIKNSGIRGLIKTIYRQVFELDFILEMFFR